MKKADIVLIPFPFTDLSGNKKRPAVVLTNTKEDVTVCFLTTQHLKQLEYDLLIQPSDSNGLKKVSIIKLNKIATLDKELVIGRIGTLEDHYIDLLNENLIKMLKLKE